MVKSPLPNFLIIGAAKSGTTTLYHYLSQHPQVYMSPVKETNFFAFEGQTLDFLGKLAEGYRSEIITTLQDYSKQFSRVTNEHAVGEACPSYLYMPKAPERIQQYIPDAKIVAILRNPVDRAFSNYLHHVRDRLETCKDFAEALELEQERIIQNWWWGYHYIQTGLYSQQIHRYYQHFDPNNIKVYLYEDLQRDLEGLIADLSSFLGLEKKSLETDKKYNKTGIPKYPIVDYLVKTNNPLKSCYQALLPAAIRKKITSQVTRLNPIEKPQLAPELHTKLIMTFKEDILELQNLIGRDLSAWLV